MGQATSNQADSSGMYVERNVKAVNLRKAFLDELTKTIDITKKTKAVTLSRFASDKPADYSWLPEIAAMRVVLESRSAPGILIDSNAFVTPASCPDGYKPLCAMLMQVKDPLCALTEGEVDALMNLCLGHHVAAVDSQQLLALEALRATLEEFARAVVTTEMFSTFVSALLQEHQDTWDGTADTLLTLTLRPHCGKGVLYSTIPHDRGFSSITLAAVEENVYRVHLLLQHENVNFAVGMSLEKAQAELSVEREENERLGRELEEARATIADRDERITHLRSQQGNERRVMREKSEAEFSALERERRYLAESQRQLKLEERRIDQELVAARTELKECVAHSAELDTEIVTMKRQVAEQAAQLQQSKEEAIHCQLVATEVRKDLEGERIVSLALRESVGELKSQLSADRRWRGTLYASSGFALLVAVVSSFKLLRHSR